MESGLGLTALLAKAAVELPLPTLHHAETIAHAWVDTIAVSLAASGEAGLQRMRSAVFGDSDIRLWAGGEQARADDAALFNGTAAHFLDYDDISPSMPLHPSAVLVPALMAAAGARAGSMRFDEFTEAYNIGATMFRYIAESLPSAEHYGRGWHSTATVGRLAAVAAIARYRRLTPAVTTNALAMASSMASGSRANFGTMTKPMHAGLAARDALNAVDWSIAGVSASSTELEAPAGFFARFVTGDPSKLAETAGERLEWWAQEWPRDWGLKRYPSCYGTHRAIDAARELREQVAAEDIARVEVGIYRGGTAPLTLRVPETGTEAKFHLQHCVALAWLHGDVTLQDFTTERFAAADRAALLAERIGLEEVDGQGEFAHVTVTTRGGATHRRTVTEAKGSGSNPLDSDELRAKVESCCDFAGISATSAKKLLDSVDGLTPTTDLLDLVAGLQANVI
jgi:2-methylcitrate dehydratase PrpD